MWFQQSHLPLPLYPILPSPYLSKNETSSFPIIFYYFLASFGSTHLHQFSQFPLFTSCRNEAISCGDVSNIKYPFWGSSREGYCSRDSELQVICENNIPKWTIGSVKHRILDWDQDQMNIRVARNDYWDTLCPNVYKNSTSYFTMFKYIEGIQSMTLFYQCYGNVTQFSGLPNQQCTPSGGASTQVYVAIAPGFSAFGTCSYAIVIPIFGSQVEAVTNNQINSAIRQGFGLEWTLDTDECKTCSTSGGECGNDDGRFACFCRDGFHQSSCSDGNVINFEADSGLSSGKLSGSISIVIGISGGTGIFIIIAVFICNRKKCFRKRGTFHDHDVEKFMESYGSLAPKRYTYLEVKKMTNSFTSKLGQGGYGIVYKASLPIDGHHVAVKLLTESKGNGEEFLNEVASISRTSHVNIVSLLGFCYEREKRALIYELMPNGSLDKFIYKRGSLDAICDFEWNLMYQIANGVARGLKYLNRGCNTRILHLDIKPHNILLDEEFCPKISDFGLAKICQKKESFVSIIGARGTIGFIAPEVFSRSFGGVSHKSDVYSYGMLVLEMIGGRKNYDNGGSHTSEMYFPEWIYRDLEQGNGLNRNMSMTDEQNEIVRKMILVSLWCIQTNPLDRPSISKVVDMLEGPIETVPFPPKPFLYSPPRSPLRFSDESSSNIHDINS